MLGTRRPADAPGVPFGAEGSKSEMTVERRGQLDAAELERTFSTSLVHVSVIP